MVAPGKIGRAFVDLIEGFGLTMSGFGRLRSTTHCANAKSASREPLTGITWVPGFTARSPKRRISQAAIDSRKASLPSVVG